MKKILIACEESQAVCEQFRKLGHEAYSADIQEPSGNHPEWHIKGDVIPLINGRCKFKTMDNVTHEIVGKWDMIIAFPPCTHLAVSGARHFEKKRADGRQREGIELFCKFFEADCEKIAIENPIGIISGDYISKWFPDLAKKYKLPIKPQQIIQPYEFGHPVRKSTCLWIRGLPLLHPTNVVPTVEDEYGFSIGGAMRYAIDENGKIISWNDPRTAKSRSKTFLGIAQAMAEQWGNFISDNDCINGQITIFDLFKEATT